MLKRIIITASALSLLTVPVTGEESETDKVKQTAKDGIIGQIQGFVSGLGDSFESDNIKHVDLSLVEEDWVVGGEATAVIKLDETDRRATFTQLSASRLDGRSTANVGLGIRQLSETEEEIYGGNVFYDHEFSAGHARFGIGLEYLTSSGSLRANHYMRASGEKTYKGVKEKALNGTDLKYSYAFDTLYKPVISYRAFRWKGDGGYKVKGREAGVTLSFSERLSLTLSNRDDDKSKADNKARLTYSVELSGNRADRAADSSSSSMRHMLYTPVQRENRIRKSKIVLGLVMSTF